MRVSHIAFLLSFPVMAMTSHAAPLSCDCEAGSNFGQIRNLSHLVLDSTVRAHFRDIPCKTTRAPSNRNMENYLRARQLTPPASRVGLQIAYLKSKYSFNASHSEYPDTRAWKSRELDMIIMSLEDLPASLFPIRANLRLTHAKKGLKGNDEMTAANSLMNFFDQWNNITPEKQASSVLHEIGHNVGNAKELASSKEWLSISRPERTVSEYAAKNPEEDFAETFVAYRYKGAWLRKHFPERFEFMKNRVYNGAEYVNSKSCRK